MNNYEYDSPYSFLYKTLLFLLAILLVVLLVVPSPSKNKDKEATQATENVEVESNIEISDALPDAAIN